jgi:hypothetical protein
MANRGQILEREDGRKVLITLHPSALLRVPPPDRDKRLPRVAARPFPHQPSLSFRTGCTQR